MYNQLGQPRIGSRPHAPSDQENRHEQRQPNWQSIINEKEVVPFGRMRIRVKAVLIYMSFLNANVVDARGATANYAGRDLFNTYNVIPGATLSH